MWESSQYLKYYIHLIFKTGFYKNKIFATNEEIIKELEKLTSTLSKPLHGFSIYFNDIACFNDNDSSNQYSDIEEIVDLILKRSITDNAIKFPIDPKISGNKQEYLKWTSSFQANQYLIKDNLNFWNESCLKEFKKCIKKQKNNIV